MQNGSENRGRSGWWRLRLKAGALALVFSVFSLLPWAHVLTAGTHAENGCSHASGLTAESVEASDTCWVCQSLVSLLQFTESAGSAVFACVAPFTQFVARAPHAPVIVRIDPASRSQAPPARA